MANEKKFQIVHAYKHICQVSCLYPEVQDSCHFHLHYQKIIDICNNTILCMQNCMKFILCIFVHLKNVLCKYGWIPLYKASLYSPVICNHTLTPSAPHKGEGFGIAWPSAGQTDDRVLTLGSLPKEDFLL